MSGFCSIGFVVSFWSGRLKLTQASSAVTQLFFLTRQVKNRFPLSLVKAVFCFLGVQKTWLGSNIPALSLKFPACSCLVLQ